MEIAGIMELVKIGRQHTLPGQLQRGAETAALRGTLAQNIDLKLHNYEETLIIDSSVAQWIQFAQNAALGSHPYILEDGPELPKVPGPH
jgi:hypothetical protein